MPFDSTPLHRAVARLAEGLARHRSAPADEQLRDGLIQRFEFTYEISHKTLKRYMESVSANPAEYDAMPFADLVRSAAEQGLLREGWPAWKVFRDNRARTSHAYDEAVAREVVAGIPAFLREAEFLASRLSERSTAVVERSA